MKQIIYLTLSLWMSVSSAATEIPDFVIAKVYDEASTQTQRMTSRLKGQEQTLHVAKEPSITRQDVASVSLISGKPPMIQFDLTKEGYKKFAELTQESLEKQIACILNGEVVCAPFVQARITGGPIDIRADFDPQYAEKILGNLRSAEGQNSPLNQK